MVLFCLLIGGWSVASSPQYLNKNNYFVVEASGRLAGSQSEWSTEVHVPVGGEVELLVHYRNARNGSYGSGPGTSPPAFPFRGGSSS